MKYLLVSIFVLTALASCKKSSVEVSEPFSGSVSGKWNYTQTYYSNGSSLIYNSTDDLKQWINFETNGSFSSNVNAFKDFNNYTIQDSNHLKFISSAQERLYFYHIESPGNKLNLSPADFLCIEGCGDIFKK